MNKNKSNRIVDLLIFVSAVIGIMNYVFISTFCVVLTIVFVMNSSGSKKITHEEVVLRQEQRLQGIKSHIEKKYGKKFVINPEGTDGGGSPIPFSSGYYTVTYEAYAEDDPDFYFIVEVVPVSISDNEIKEIRDSYCWKFLREKLNNEVIEALDGSFDGDYKLILDLSSSATFEDNIRPDSPIEDYFNGSSKSPAIYIDLFTAEKDLELETEQNIAGLLNQIKEKSNHVDINFCYYEMNNYEDFDAIDITKEDLRLYDNEIYRTYRAVRDMEKEMKFQLTIDTDDI